MEEGVEGCCRMSRGQVGLLGALGRCLQGSHHLPLVHAEEEPPVRAPEGGHSVEHGAPQPLHQRQLQEDQGPPPRLGLHHLHRELLTQPPSGGKTPWGMWGGGSVSLRTGLGTRCMDNLGTGVCLYYRVCLHASRWWTLAMRRCLRLSPPSQCFVFPPAVCEGSNFSTSLPACFLIFLRKNWL